MLSAARLHKRDGSREGIMAEYWNDVIATLISEWSYNTFHHSHTVSVSVSVIVRFDRCQTRIHSFIMRDSYLHHDHALDAITQFPPPPHYYCY